MTDIVSPETRSRMMSGVRGKNTKIEMIVRKALFAQGFRYRLHDRRLPGKPDLVFPRYRAVILIHGCFWHGHDCGLFRLPATRTDFWSSKIASNRARDERTMQQIRSMGWRCLTLWECSLRGRQSLGEGYVVEAAIEWLRHGEGDMTLAGRDATNQSGG